MYIIFESSSLNELPQHKDCSWFHVGALNCVIHALWRERGHDQGIFERAGFHFWATATVTKMLNWPVFELKWHLHYICGKEGSAEQSVNTSVESDIIGLQCRHSSNKDECTFENLVPQKPRALVYRDVEVGDISRWFIPHHKWMIECGAHQQNNTGLNASPPQLCWWVCDAVTVWIFLHSQWYPWEISVSSCGLLYLLDICPISPKSQEPIVFKLHEYCDMWGRRSHAVIKGVVPLFFMWDCPSFFKSWSQSGSVMAMSAWWLLTFHPGPSLGQTVLH